MTDRFNPGDMVDGRYRIMERVGSGGMADVYCAEDLQLGRKVALKLLYRRFAEDSEFVERFRREASSAAGLQHPNVVAVYDRGEESGTQYIAMEYVEGRSLKEIIRAEGALAPDRAIDLVSQVLRAARFAHKRGIVHRDLKPQNVIVDAEDRAKVADFGIARAGASEMTQTGSIMGTAQYVSPEQAQGHPVSAQSDLYSIGIVLYELLTGRVPFDGESAVAVALQQVGAEPIPPSQLNPGVTPELERVVLRALEKDPADRHADADDFLEDLESARAALPLSASTAATSVFPAPVVPVPGVPEPPVGPVTSSYEALAYHDPVHAPPPAPESEGSGRKWWIALIGGLVVAAIVIGALLLSGGKKVDVPLVVGEAETVARTSLTTRGFDVVSQRRISPQPKGQVIAQKPLAGASVDEGSTVTVTISAGPGTASVPELKDKTAEAARKELVMLEFQVTEREQADPKVAKGKVIETNPAAGQRIDKGSTVTLVISTGPEMVEVPDVVGKSQEDAETALTTAGLEATVVQQESSEDPGTVISQDPLKDKEVVKGSKVKLVVAIEPTEVEVPNTIGKSQNEAVATLSGAGFKVVSKEEKVDSAAQDFLVLSQTPSSGKLKKGETVNIVVGKFDAGTSTTSTTDDEDTGSP